MSPPPPATQRYLARRGVAGPWRLAGTQADGLTAAVVIPALAEGESLFASLASLAANPAAELRRTLVVVVVNHGPAASAADQARNRADLQRLAQGAAPGELQLCWIDAASPGLELPAAQAGVGLARKLGLDRALERLDWSAEPLLICLDADTLVEPGYLAAIRQHFATAPQGAAVLPFCHRPADEPAGQAAIDRYELFMRCHLLGLSRAGSPYAFITLGSAIACRASSYVRSGGMSRRRAGEDFYFLQQLARTDGVSQLQGTRVYPAPRVSHRVPFGTGRGVTRLLQGDDAAVRPYPVDCYRILAAWLAAVAATPLASADQLLRTARGISTGLAEFLVQADWRQVWTRLAANHARPQERLKAFHDWFDALRTLRLIHALCAADYPRRPVEEAAPALLAWCGLPTPAGRQELLNSLRQLQNGC